jgi:hypothetical protein
MTSKPPKKHSKSVKEQSVWNCADLIDAERRNALNALPKSIVAHSKKLSKLKKELNRLKLSLIGHPITPANESLVGLHQSFIAKLPFKDELEIFRKVSAQFPPTELTIQNHNRRPKKPKYPKRELATDSYYIPSFNEKPTQDQNPSLTIIVVLASPTTNPTKQASSSVKREHNKLQKRERDKSWQKEYKKLKRKHPNLSNTEISRRIAKMPIAQDKSAETIRKIMTK